MLGVGLATPYSAGLSRTAGGLSNTDSTSADQVFSLSVMSGDPSPSGVVLWTRIDPHAYVEGRPLGFQVAQDPAFRVIAFEGTIGSEQIGSARDYTVTVDLDGRLLPGMRYYYRFIYGGVSSRRGRCRTAPHPALGARSLRFAVLSCQDYTNGYYGAFRTLSQRDDVDFVIHLGDFIYESAADPRFQFLPFEDRQLVLPSGGSVALDLEDFRHIYRTYRSDPDFQRCLENHTFIVVWDDHETANDAYWDYERDTLGAPDHPFTLDPAYGNDAGRLRRLALDARRAWLEYVPARVKINRDASHPHDFVQIYRKLEFGGLLDLFMTDGRSYRSPHPCGEGVFGERFVPQNCDFYQAPERTMLGPAQRDWLVQETLRSRAQWQVWGNQVLMAELSVGRGGQALPLNVDAWDGFQAERQFIAEEMRGIRRPNLVVLTGDFHSYVVSYLKVNYGRDINHNPLNTIGVEFMTTSVTSAGGLDQINAALSLSQRQPILDLAVGQGLIQSLNPHIRLADLSQHGYSVIEFNHRYCEWTAYVVDKNRRGPIPPRERVYRKYRHYAGTDDLDELPAWGPVDRVTRWL